MKLGQMESVKEDSLDVGQWLNYSGFLLRLGVGLLVSEFFPYLIQALEDRLTWRGRVCLGGRGDHGGLEVIVAADAAATGAAPLARRVALVLFGLVQIVIVVAAVALPLQLLSQVGDRFCGEKVQFFNMKISSYKLGETIKPLLNEPRIKE